jgi:hypothetical protein
LETLNYAGIPIVTSRLVEPGKMMLFNGRVVMRPVDWLYVLHPYSPVWCARTLGHREMDRDRRLRRRG